METQADIVADPVGHISISGVHGRKELDERLSNARVQGVRRDRDSLGRLVAAALIGAAIMYVLHPARRSREFRV